MNVINQQILSYQQSDAGLLEQIEKETKNLEKHKADLTGLYEEKSQLDEKLDQADDVLDEAKKQYQDLEQDITAKEQAIEDAKADIIEYLNEGGTLKAKVGRYDTMLENILRNGCWNIRARKKKQRRRKYSLPLESKS